MKFSNFYFVSWMDPGIGIELNNKYLQLAYRLYEQRRSCPSPKMAEHSNRSFCVIDGGFSIECQVVE